MSDPDPWQEAADCERAAQRQTDPDYFAIYITCRIFWLALASERNFLNESEYQERVDSIAGATLQMGPKKISPWVGGRTDRRTVCCVPPG
jgi:hypothetical protein